jgi:hypothetical protein
MSFAARITLAAGIAALTTLVPSTTHAQATRPRATSPSASTTSASAPSAAEEASYAARAERLRARILAASSWTDLGGDSCSVGMLRTFPTDGESSSHALDAVAELERIIVARGIDNPIDTPAGHALMRTVAAWEAFAERPRWDVAAGQTAPRAIAAGLGGGFRNPTTRKCETYLPGDTATIVLPPLTNFTPPRTEGVRLTLYYGEPGVRRARDLFHGTVAQRDSGAVFSYTRVRAAVLWRDYAVVAVNRPAEVAGVLTLSKGLGGGTYIFRRVGDEWRLLVIVRTWA